MSSGYVPAKELADYLGLSEMRVVQLVQDGIIKRDGKGKYPLRDCVRAYCEYSRGVSRGSDTVKLERIERTRYTKIKADLAELERAEKNGVLVNADIVRRQDYALSVILKNNLQSMPDRISAIVAAESDAAVVHNVISTEVRTSLNSIIEAMEAEEVDDATLDITRQAASDALDDASQEDDE